MLIATLTCVYICAVFAFLLQYQDLLPCRRSLDSRLSGFFAFRSLYISLKKYDYIHDYIYDYIHDYIYDYIYIWLYPWSLSIVYEYLWLYLWISLCRMYSWLYLRLYIWPFCVHMTDIFIYLLWIILSMIVRVVTSFPLSTWQKIFFSLTAL
jgi:hypothetical protein